MQVIQVADGACQAHAVLAELRRLRQLGVTDWSSIAVLSREHRDLAQVRTLAEDESIPVRWVAARNAMPPLHHVREIHRFLAQLETMRGSFKRASDLCRLAIEMFGSLPPIPGPNFSAIACSRRGGTSPGMRNWPCRTRSNSSTKRCAESRREFTYGEGVTLSTVHSAKGTEFDHVLLIGALAASGSEDAQEEERRTFYVGLTRARRTLTVLDRRDVRPSLPETLAQGT